MDAIVAHAESLHGSLTIPPDKAITHRVILAAALAAGETQISPWSAADDCQYTLHCVEQLGASVQQVGEQLWIRGTGAGRLSASPQPLFCGESGTTMRLLAGVLGGQPFSSTLTAGPLLSRRPMGRIAEPLAKMGVRIDGKRVDGELYPPLTMQESHSLRSIQYRMPVASAQVKSALLFAGLSASGPTTVEEPSVTRDHTERILRHFGIDVASDLGRVVLTPSPLRSPGRCVVPGDCSSAAFLACAAACLPGSSVTLNGVGLNPTRIAVFRVLERMGAQLQMTVTDERWEPRGTVVISGGRLHATVIEPYEVAQLIDELPVLMVAATHATGTTCLRGVGELRVKETDRIQSMLTGLRHLGATIELVDRETIQIAPSRLRSHVVESAADHRTAMSLVIAGLLAEGGSTRVRGVECVAKSFPEFFTLLDSVTGSSTVKTIDTP